MSDNVHEWDILGHSGTSGENIDHSEQRCELKRLEYPFLKEQLVQVQHLAKRRRQSATASEGIIRLRLVIVQDIFCIFKLGASGTDRGDLAVRGRTQG